MIYSDKRSYYDGHPDSDREAVVYRNYRLGGKKAPTVGDWWCGPCQYVNFKRNELCLNCNQTAREGSLNKYCEI